MRTFLEPPSHSERLLRFENALKHFVQTYKLSSINANALRERLIRRPEGVKRREERLYVGWSVAEPTDLRVSAFAQNLFSAVKEVGWLDGATPNERDTFRKRVERTGSSIQRPIGRKKFPYLALEMTYILAIFEFLPLRTIARKEAPAPRTRGIQKIDYWLLGTYANKAEQIKAQSAKPKKRPRMFPYSRRSDGTFSGPAFNLLTAALDLALPHSGADALAGIAKRIDALNKQSKPRSDR
jgi:hypothetical protein